MVNYNRRSKAMLIVIGLVVCSMTLSSCDSLKKKFIRQKRKGQVDDQNFVPVLEPIDYPSPQNDAQSNYKENYGLIKAWYKDLWTAIDDKSSARYVHYVLTQVTNHISQMQSLVDAPTQAQLTKLAAYLDYYKDSLDQSWQVRNVSRIQSDLRGFDRFLRDKLRADKIQGHFIAPSAKEASAQKPADTKTPAAAAPAATAPAAAASGAKSNK